MAHLGKIAILLHQTDKSTVIHDVLFVQILNIDGYIRHFIFRTFWIKTNLERLNIFEIISLTAALKTTQDLELRWKTSQVAGTYVWNDDYDSLTSASGEEPLGERVGYLTD